MQKVTFVQGKGWNINNKYYPSFTEASKQFKDIKVRTNGMHQLNPVITGERYVYDKLGGFKGALEDLLFGSLKRKTIQKEKQFLNILEKKEEQIKERKVQKRLTRFGIKPPLKRSQFVPYAFRR